MTVVTTQKKKLDAEVIERLALPGDAKAVLYQLRRGPATFCRIARGLAKIDVTEAAVAQAMVILTKAGIIAGEVKDDGMLTLRLLPVEAWSVDEFFLAALGMRL